MERGIPEVAEYIRVLARSRDSTTSAGDRRAYESHLASAARLVALLDRRADDAEVQRWFDAEQRGYGRSYLSGEEDAAAESAFVGLKARLLGHATL